MAEHVNSKKPRPHFVWGPEIQAMVEETATIIKGWGADAPPLSLYFYRSGQYQLNRSVIVQYCIEQLAAEARDLTHSDWMRYVRRFEALEKGKSVGLALHENTPFDKIIAALERWEWKDFKAVIVQKGRAVNQLSKGAIVVIALLRFTEKHGKTS